MADVFNRDTQFGAAISSDGARVTFDDFGVGLLIQNIAVSYAQSVNRIFEVGSTRQYYVVGRPQGNMTLSRVVGPVGITTAFVEKFGDGCNADKNTIHFTASAGCSRKNGQLMATGINYLASNVIIMNMAINVAAADMVISEQFQMMFVGLQARAGIGIPNPIGRAAA